MRDRPAGVTERDLARALADGWGLTAPTLRLRYAPVGGGSYHWVAGTPGTEHAWDARQITIAQLTQFIWPGPDRPASGGTTPR